ncbi:MFS transporter [Actinopolymorpha sp. NPDC004070]|uniref:MFS transporter n=1 Tax=Actinopolymorpha sp. NPDC004070 TaxID=3154548 RepID=UPI0033AEFDE4
MHGDYWVQPSCPPIGHGFEVGSPLRHAGEGGADCFVGVLGVGAAGFDARLLLRGEGRGVDVRARVANWPERLVGRFEGGDVTWAAKRVLVQIALVCASVFFPLCWSFISWMWAAQSPGTACSSVSTCHRVPLVGAGPVRARVGPGPALGKGIRRHLESAGPSPATAARYSTRMRDEAIQSDSEVAPPPREVLRLPAFAFFWSASTIRAFGGSIAGVAFQILVVKTLDATPVQISILSALGVVPYLFLGLIIGALMDRWRRQRALMITSVGRAVAMASVPVLLLTGVLNFWSLATVVLVLGVLTLFADSAAQPFLPRIVPRNSLVMANARLGQSETVAGTVGPALGGALLNLVGAPILFFFEAAINAVAAVLQSRIRVDEPRPEPRPHGRHIGHDIADGMRYTYQHRTLRPLAISVHTWFLANSIVSTVFAVFVLRELDMPAWAYGVTLAVGGVGGFLGALVAPPVGARLGAGRAILLGRTLVVIPWLVLAVAPLTASSGIGVVLAVASLAQFIYCLAMGIEDANDTAYRQAVAPDAIQGRMNSTIRTVNRVIYFFGALLTGALMTFLGYHLAIGIGAAIFALAALVVLVSPLRNARQDDGNT